MKETIYFEAKVKKSKTPIDKVIKDLGIVYPNDSLGFFHAVYAKFEEANANKVILADSVKSDVPKLKFTQANMNHNRELGPVLGTILDAFVNEKTNEIEIVCSFFKSVYPKHWETAQELMEKGELTVSFELKVDKDDIEVLSGGVRRLKQVDFDGVGLLFAVKPAYKNANVLQLANEIVNKVFDKSRELVYASAKDAVDKLEKTSKAIEEIIKSKEEDNQVDKKAKDALLAKFKEDVIKELGEEAVKNWSEAEWEDELAKRSDSSEEVAESTEEVVEEKKEEAKEEVVEEKEEEEATEEVVEEKEEAKEEVVEEKEESAELHKQEEETKIKTTDVYDDEAKTETITTEVESVVKNNDKEVMRKKVSEETTYSFAEVEEEKAKVKEEYEAKVSEKDEEIKTLTAQVSFYKENATKIAEIRAELSTYVDDLSDEDLLDNDKLEIARLKKQLDEAKSKEVETASDVNADSALLKTADDQSEKEEEVEETSADRVKAFIKEKYNK